MAFKVDGTLAPWGGPLLRKEIVANSVALVTQDAVVADTDGFIALAAAGNSVFGHVMGIQTNKGVGLNTTGVAGAEMGSFIGAYTMASDNETVAKVRAEIDISTMTLYSGTTDATVATTAGSDQLGIYMDLADEDDLDESTVADTTAQYHSWGVDAADPTTRLIVNIFESSVFNTV